MNTTIKFSPDDTERIYNSDSTTGFDNIAIAADNALPDADIDWIDEHHEGLCWEVHGHAIIDGTRCNITAIYALNKLLEISTAEVRVEEADPSDY